MRVSKIRPFQVSVDLVFVARSRAGGATFQVHVVRVRGVLVAIRNRRDRLVIVVHGGGPQGVTIHFCQGFRFFYVLHHRIVEVRHGFQVLLADLQVFVVVVTKVWSLSRRLRQVFKGFQFIRARGDRLLTIQEPDRRIHCNGLFFVSPVNGTVRSFVRFAIFHRLSLYVVVRFAGPCVVIACVDSRPPIQQRYQGRLLTFQV